MSPPPRRGRSTAPDARGPAPARSSSGVSPTWSASSGAQPASSRAGSKIAGSGLRAPAPAEVTTPSSSAVEPAAVEHVGQRDVPVGDADEAQPAVAQLGQRRRRVVEGAGSGSRPSSSRPDLAAELAREHRGAARAQLGQRGGVAALVAVLACSSAISARTARTRRSSGSTSERRRQVRPTAARARRACRARRAARRGGRAGSCEHSHGGTRPRMREELSRWTRASGSSTAI